MSVCVPLAWKKRWIMGAAVAAMGGCAPEARPSQTPDVTPTYERSEPVRRVEPAIEVAEVPEVETVDAESVHAEPDAAGALDAARGGVLSSVAVASSGRVDGVRQRAELVDALRRLDARITRARVNQLRGRAEFDPIEVERIEELHSRCHELIGSVELSIEPEPAELDRRARRLEREASRVLAAHVDAAL